MNLKDEEQKIKGRMYSKFNSQEKNQVQNEVRYDEWIKVVQE